MHVGTLKNVRYDMIIGSDLLETLKVDIKYSTATIEWDGAEVPMHPRDATIEDSYLLVIRRVFKKQLSESKKYSTKNMNRQI